MTNAHRDNMGGIKRRVFAVISISNWKFHQNPASLFPPLSPKNTCHPEAKRGISKCSTALVMRTFRLDTAAKDSY
jgi:hypothetical protein